MPSSLLNKTIYGHFQSRKGTKTESDETQSLMLKCSDNLQFTLVPFVAFSIITTVTIVREIGSSSPFSCWVRDPMAKLFSAYATSACLLNLYYENDQEKLEPMSPLNHYGTMLLIYTLIPALFYILSFLNESISRFYRVSKVDEMRFEEVFEQFMTEEKQINKKSGTNIIALFHLSYAIICFIFIYSFFEIKTLLKASVDFLEGRTNLIGVLKYFMSRHPPRALCRLPVHALVDPKGEFFDANSYLVLCALTDNVILQYGNIVMASTLGIALTTSICRTLVIMSSDKEFPCCS